MKELADLQAKAERFLKTAEKALEIGDYDSCVSRCYYAMFFMVEALLLTKGLTASSHKGVLGLYGQHFVKTGIFGRESGKALSEAYDKRLIGDYGVGLSLTTEETTELLRTAHAFVKQAKVYLERWQQEQGKT